MVCDLWYFEDLEDKDQLLNQLINDEAVTNVGEGPYIIRNFYP